MSFYRVDRELSSSSFFCNTIYCLRGLLNLYVICIPRLAFSCSDLILNFKCWKLSQNCLMRTGEWSSEAKLKSVLKLGFFFHFFQSNGNRTGFYRVNHELSSSSLFFTLYIIFVVY